MYILSKNPVRRAYLFFIIPMALVTTTLSNVTYTTTTNYFSLSIEQNKTKTHILMTLFTPIVNTRDIAHTYDILEQTLPEVLGSQCFNDDQLPFCQEVCRTEIGHLFEHILLEYMCLIQIAHGENYAEYEGVTQWNWKKDPRGTFHIKISAGQQDLAIFSQALEKTVQLMSFIFQSSSFEKSTQEYIPEQIESLTSASVLTAVN